nr:hypothetical protein CFP56_70679 [Quercus suber]
MLITIDALITEVCRNSDALWCRYECKFVTFSLTTDAIIQYGIVSATRICTRAAKAPRRKLDSAKDSQVPRSAFIMSKPSRAYTVYGITIAPIPACITVGPELRQLHSASHLHTVVVSPLLWNLYSRGGSGRLPNARTAIV